MKEQREDQEEKKGDSGGSRVRRKFWDRTKGNVEGQLTFD